MISEREKLEAYVLSVKSGKKLSCEMERLAVDRWLSDLERPDLRMDWKIFDRFCRFSSSFKHFKGPLAGEYIKLEGWQLFDVANIFGLIRTDTGFRKYTYADVYVPRKNGKTVFAAIIALFCELLDGESGAEVYAAAVDKEQAKICFNASRELIRRSDFADFVTIRTGAIVYMDTASTYKPLSKDTKNKDGLNPSAAICDERHAWKTNEIYEVIKTGMGARSQPLLFSISTAGTDTSYPYFADLEILRDVLRGKKEKDNHYVQMFEPDEGDNWDDERTWWKVNPNLGVSLSLDYMRNECSEAKLKGGSTLAAFRTKNLNMWVDAPSVWIPDDKVVSNNAVFDVSQLGGEECYVGIDLARKTDICAVSFWFPKYKVFRFLFVVPEAKIIQSDRGDRVDYRKWMEEGWITESPGEVLDEDWFVSLVLREFDRYSIKCIAYDPWSMWSILPKFGRYSDKLLEYRQDIRYMSVPTKWFESAVLNQELNFLDNPVIRWMIGNVVIYTDPNANIKLDKARSRNKIDGVVAAVDAVGGWLNKTSGKTGEIYCDHELRVIKSKRDGDQ